MQKRIEEKVTVDPDGFIQKEEGRNMNKETRQRLPILRKAVKAWSKGGKDRTEIRKMIQLQDHNVWKHENDAVFLELHNVSTPAFNEGVYARLFGGKSRNPYIPGCEYANFVNWSTGWDSADLALALHGRDKVVGTL
jgi:hypothetical protein